ncbi:unnamed protein product [Onchocerca flexuosa]|uniref:Gag-pol polyprotein n=1 Tax=Onchocerca flexuosa TaxID=387005 RepID=A0A183HRD3_9BILA|nr:unnamed protein product [Onchocerca flexuosa]
MVIEGLNTKSTAFMEEKMTSDVVMSRIFGAELTTQSTDASSRNDYDDDDMTEKMGKETTATTNEFGFPIESKNAASTVDNVDKSATKVHIQIQVILSHPKKKNEIRANI